MYGSRSNRARGRIKFAAALIFLAGVALGLLNDKPGPIVVGALLALVTLALLFLTEDH